MECEIPKGRNVKAWIAHSLIGCDVSEEIDEFQSPSRSTPERSGVGSEAHLCRVAVWADITNALLSLRAESVNKFQSSK